MATNATFISNTLVNKYLAYDGRNMAVHGFPTQNAGEFLIKLLFPFLSKPGLIASWQGTQGHSLSWAYSNTSSLNWTYSLPTIHCIQWSAICDSLLWLPVVSAQLCTYDILHDLHNGFHDMRSCISFMCKPSHNWITCKMPLASRKFLHSPCRKLGACVSPGRRVPVRKPLPRVQHLGHI